MLHIIKAPLVDVNERSVTIVEILVKEGDIAKEHDELVVVETFKAMLSVESGCNGIVRKILISEGEEVACGNPMVIIADSIDEDISDVLLDGVIRTKDVVQFIDKGGRKKEIFHDVKHHVKKMTGVERGVLATLSWSKQVAAPAYLEQTFDTRPLINRSNKLREKQGLIFNPAFHILAWEYVRFVAENPEFNCTCSDQEIIFYDEINLGITVDSDGNLYLPVLRNANNLELEEFTQEIFNLQRKTMSNKLVSDDLRHPTIGITSLANYNVTRHIPILPPYVSLMLAHSSPSIYPGGPKMSCLGITYDHRVHAGTKVAGMLSGIINKL